MNIIFKNIKPKYIELYEAIIEKINSKELIENTKLPSKRNLALDLNVSLNTVINAYNLLIDEGYIYTIEKKGYFVNTQPLCITPKEFPTLKTIPQNEKIKYDFTTQNIISFKANSYKKIIKDLLYTNTFLNKTNHLGYEELRITISKHLKENRGITINKNQIIIASGMEIFERILKLSNYKNIGLENPGYHKLGLIAKNIDISLNYYDVDAEGVIIPNKKCILYTTPFNQFPTGNKMSIKRKNELIKWALDTDSLIIEDDFDAEFRINALPTTTLISLCPERVIFFSTFSTTLFPGLRISYTILPTFLINKYNELYSSYSNSVPTLNQLIINDFIKKGYYASHINKKKKEYLIIRKKCIEYFTNYKDIIKINKDKNYLSVLIEIIPNINIKKLQDNLLKKGLKIQALSDFDIYDNPSNTLILGYTAINEIDLNDGLNLIINEIKNQL